MKVPLFILPPGAVGRGQNSRANPHHVFRPGGSDTWLLEYTVSGCGVVRRDERLFKVNPGDFLLFKPATPQDYGMDEQVGEWDHIWFCFHPRPHWHDWLVWPELAEGIYCLPLRDERTRRYLLERMEMALKITRGIHLRRYDFIMNVLEEVLLNGDDWNPVRQQSCLDERIRTALNYLCDHSAQRITLSDLAKACSLSPSRLSHLFKAQMGETPMQYLEQRRIERAGILLQMTRKTVSQVAYEIGFENPFYFSRVFKRHTGKSPRQIR